MRGDQNNKKTVYKSCQKQKTEKSTFGTRPLKRFKFPPLIDMNQVANPDEFIMSELEETVALNIAYGEPWTKEERDALSPEDKELFCIVLSKAMNVFAGQDRDLLYSKVENCIAPENKNDYWEQNHFRILKAIDKLTREIGRFPSRMEIVNDTGLSRTTINKHLKEYFGSDQFREKKEEYIALRERLLARLYRYAIDGNMKAARIFIEATAETVIGPQIKNQQNNLIQINGSTITSHQLRLLPTDKLKQLEEILSIANAFPVNQLLNNETKN